MAYTEFNLTDLFAAQWGFRPNTIKISDPDGGKNIRATAGGEIKISDKNLVNRKSETGKYGEYYKTDIMGRYVFMPVTLGDLFLPYCWISISGSKRIVETPLTERRGTVKELIAMEDYKISIKGFVIGHDGRFPEKDVEDLKTLFERNEALEIKCILTDIFLLTPEHGGQDKVVITDFSLNDNQGIEHVRGWEMSLTTDQILELELA